MTRCGGGGNPNGGAGWLDDGAPDASRRAFRPFHLAPSVLRSSTTAGHIISFQLAALGRPAAFDVGDTVSVAYEKNRARSLLATSITYPGSAVASGTVSDIAPDGSSFSVQTATGQTLMLAVPNAQLMSGLVDGDTVQVTHTTGGSTLTVRVLTVTSTAPAAGSDGTGSYPGY